MEEQWLNKILDMTINLGASYADVRYQYHDRETITVENKALENYSSKRPSGLGIRITIKGTIGDDLRNSSQNYSPTVKLSQSTIAGK